MSKCPVDHKKITETLMNWNQMLELPWVPLYTQSGKTFRDNSRQGEEISTLALWSLAATIAFTVLVYTFESHLDARQKEAYQRTTFPKELETTVSKIDAGRMQKDKDTKPLLEQLQAKFKSAQAYGLDKINFGMIASSYDMLESVAFLLIGFFPYVWDKSVEIGSSWFGLSADDEIKITLIFLLLVTIVGTVTSLPFEIYSTFQIERKHGFNKQTFGLFVTDKIKSLILTFAIGGPFIALLLKIIKVGAGEICGLHCVLFPCFCYCQPETDPFFSGVEITSIFMCGHLCLSSRYS